MYKPNLTTIYENYNNTKGIKREGYATLYKMYDGKKEVDSFNVIMRLYLYSVERIDRAYENYRKLQMKHSQEGKGYTESHEREEIEFYVKRFQGILNYYSLVIGFKLIENIDYDSKVYRYQLVSENGYTIEDKVNLMPQYLIGSIQTNLISIYYQMRELDGKSISKTDLRNLEEFRDEAVYIIRNSNLKFT